MIFVCSKCPRRLIRDLLDFRVKVRGRFIITRISGCIAMTVAMANSAFSVRLKGECGGLLLSARQPTVFQRLKHPCLDLLRLQSEIERAEGNIIKKQWHEELVIRVLEYQFPLFFLISCLVFLSSWKSLW